MNANELRPLLVEYRSQVEQAWTVETAHPGYSAGNGKPDGQCGATSAWLQGQLWLNHGILTYFTEGSLLARGGVLAKHCWLEAGDHQLVLDLTADQLAIDHRVVCDTHWTAWSLGLEYIGFDAEVDDDLARRMHLLSEAVNA